jgi:hypothetical protein
MKKLLKENIERKSFFKNKEKERNFLFNNISRKTIEKNEKLKKLFNYEKMKERLEKA